MDSMFWNPILAGFYPDPSICRVDNDFYLVTSTFAYFPGIPVFHSKDLINWKLLGHVMDRREQMDTQGLGISRGIFAPSIRYHEELFYVTCTLVDKGGNFIVTAEKPAGPWSNPVWIPEINGIDPSPFFDENGKAYIVYNSIAPDNKPLYDGHRTLRMYEFDLEHLRVTGEEMLLVNGGVDLSKQPIWIEAPHIFQKDGYYYLIAAEGGTAEQHSAVVFRSKNVAGPYIPYEHNPILSQRHLPPDREHPVTSTGHADFVRTPAGDWWSVFLGCRTYPPYEKDYYNTGRETFMAPVVWKDGWPVINPDEEEVQYSYPNPIPGTRLAETGFPYSGNFTIRDDFDTEQLNPNWVFLRTPHEQWYNLTNQQGFLSIKLRPETCSGTGNPSFLGRRQQHLNSAASLSVRFDPQAENEKAGLLVFQSEQHWYFIGKSLEGGNPVIQLYQSNKAGVKLIASQPAPGQYVEQAVSLKIESAGIDYSFYFSYDNESWTLLADQVDGSFLSTKVAGGFVGCMYALYASSHNRPSSNIALFDWFSYQGNDVLYR